MFQVVSCAASCGAIAMVVLAWYSLASQQLIFPSRSGLLCGLAILLGALGTWLAQELWGILLGWFSTLLGLGWFSLLLESGQIPVGILGYLAISLLVVFAVALAGCGDSHLLACAWKRLAAFCVVMGLVLLLECQFPYATVSQRAPITVSISHCREINIALKGYAADHNGSYPDAAFDHPLNSNEVLRKLFIEGYISDEWIFGSSASPYHPDGLIGQAPEYKEALKAGENHWAMTKGLTDSSPANIPLVFENPVVATWPPRWNVNAVEVAQPGRVWKGKRVIVGLNDGSANLMHVEMKKSPNVGQAMTKDASRVFPDLDPKPEILNVEK